MTQPPQGPPYPPQPPKRFSGAAIAGGILLGIALVVVFPVLGAVLSGQTGLGVAPLIVGLGLAVLGPLVLGGVLVRSGPPERRGLGLGLLIGWGTTVIIGGGTCVAIIAALTTTGGGA